MRLEAGRLTQQDLKSLCTRHSGLLAAPPSLAVRAGKHLTDFLAKTAILGRSFRTVSCWTPRILNNAPHLKRENGLHDKLVQ